MKKSIALLAAILILPSLAAAKPKHWYTDPKWWIGTAIMAGATAADYATTARDVRAGLTESNPLLGYHPGAGRLAGTGALAFTFYAGFHAIAWHGTHEDSQGWRTAGYLTMPILFGSLETYAAVHNARLLK